MEDFMTGTRKRHSPEAALEVRLARVAETARLEAEKLPEGAERNALLGKARQAQVAVEISGWLEGPGGKNDK
jgi:hypothetical protein